MKQQDEIRTAAVENGRQAEPLYRAAASRRSTGRTQDIDRHVGARVRERRIMLGLTQQQLADLIFDGLQDQNTRAVSPRERMCLELARNFAQIPNERHQEALSQLARVLAAD